MVRRMRTLLALVLSAGLVGVARADGPEETKPAETQPAPAQPAPVAAQPAPVAAQPAPVAAEPAPAPQPVPAAALPATRSDEEVQPNPSKKYGFAFLGAAGGAFVLAIATGAAALAKSAEQEGNTGSPAIYTQDLKDSAAAGKSLADASYAFTIVGAVLAVVDGVIWFEVLRKPKVVKKSTASIELTPMGVRF
jgi:hypothetical protein